MCLHFEKGAASSRVRPVEGGKTKCSRALVLSGHLGTQQMPPGSPLRCDLTAIIVCQAPAPPLRESLQASSDELNLPHLCPRH